MTLERNSYIELRTLSVETLHSRIQHLQNMAQEDYVDPASAAVVFDEEIAVTTLMLELHKEILHHLAITTDSEKFEEVCDQLAVKQRGKGIEMMCTMRGKKGTAEGEKAEAAELFEEYLEDIGWPADRWCLLEDCAARGMQRVQ